MRRKDREKDSNFTLRVLRDCEYATLATVNADGTPYCIPISPVLAGNTIYSRGIVSRARKSTFAFGERRGVLNCPVDS